MTSTARIVATKSAQLRGLPTMPIIHNDGCLHVSPDMGHLRMVVDMTLGTILDGGSH